MTEQTVRQQTDVTAADFDSGEYMPIRGERPIVARAREFSSGYRVTPHKHECCQLIFATSGVMELVTDEGVWLIPPQRAVWMPPNVEHGMRARGDVSLRTMYIQPHACPVSFPQKPRTLQISPLLRELIIRAMRVPSNYDEGGRDGRIMSLILEEIEWSDERPLRLPATRDSRLQNLCRAILANPADPRELKDWSTVIGASERTLSRLFRNELGVSYQYWRQQVAALNAIPRLAAGDPVTLIAADLGYETPGAFSAMFRRIMGVAPSLYFQRQPER